MKKISVGIRGVDNILLGGIPKGKTILLSGPCGAGKTIFASHFINEGISQNKPGVYVSLEQDKDKLIADLKEINIDWTKKKKTNKLRIMGGNIGYIRILKKKRKATAQDFIEEILEVIQEIKADRIAIDSINLFLDLFETDREKRDVLTELIYQLQQEGVTTLLTCEIKENSKRISWYGFEEFVVDGVLLLRRAQNNATLSMNRIIQVIKMRGAQFKDGEYPLEIRNMKGMIVYLNNPRRSFFSD